MTAHEALWLLKVQLQRTEQNIEAIQVIEDIVNLTYKIHIDDEPTYTLDEAIHEVFGTEAEHIKNHMSKVGKKDIKELGQNMCARYDWADDDELVQFYELCDTEENK